MSIERKVDITEVRKRGEWYTVTGISEGKKTSVDIPAATLESRDRKSAEGLMKRSILGTVMNE